MTILMKTFKKTSVFNGTQIALDEFLSADLFGVTANKVIAEKRRKIMINPRNHVHIAALN